MEKESLGKDFWDGRHLSGDTGWDVGYPSPPLREYFDQLNDLSLRILIPGCGNAWEAEYLYNKGFKNISLLDISPEALKKFRERNPGFPVRQLFCTDFFRHKGKYDLIAEQTFFCAIHPSLRKDYVLKMHSLLGKGGKLCGLLFDDRLNNDAPPFGGNRDEYISLFSPCFRIKTIERAYNSIQPRAGRELFFIFEKK